MTRRSGVDSPDVVGSRLARLAVATITVGFFVGGFGGILNAHGTAGWKVRGAVLLAGLLLLHLYNCVHRPDGSRPAYWPWTLAGQVLLTYLPLLGYARTWYGNPGFLAGAVRC